MWECGCNDGLGGGDRLDEHARHHLLAGEIREEHDVRRSHLGENRSRAAVAVVELYELVDAERLGAGDERIAIGLARFANDVRMGLAENDVPGRRVEVAELREGVER